MDIWNRKTLKSLVLPSGLTLLLALLVLQSGSVQVSASAVDLFYYVILAAGILLAWRFQSSGILSALMLILISHRALEFFSAGKIVFSGPGRVAFEVIGVLLPLNFVALGFASERRITLSTVGARGAWLFVQSVFVAAVCRPGTTKAPAIFHAAWVSKRLFQWTHLPQSAVLIFLLSFCVLAARFWIHRKPTTAGLLWALAAVFAGMQAGGVGRIGSAYFAVAALILVSSIVENSYLLAYHDELTSLPARRAFNLALPGLTAPYSVAAVDIDHFKSVNDTYGHDTGDQVLRMVAARLSRVTGGGEAYRVGGEEFTILFPGKTAKEVLPHLQVLRQAIEQSSFRLRISADRRTAPRESNDRRAHETKGSPGRKRRVVPTESVAGELSVTVSMGLAEPNSKTQEISQVIEAADKALYRAKQSGRNRVETAGAQRARARAKRATA